ncbi:hypothetical protein [Nocardia sp. NPDC051570]|uniref:hypothetical protein n=1 Tax=Nocardia sp. NPDC051570 TaxID=3364324 RepID=UPI00379A585F
MADPVSAASGQPQFDSQVAYWRNLKQQAEGGTFRLDPDLATELRNHAEEMRQKLVELQRRARNLSTLSGFGALPSSTTLQTAFEQKADGGPDSLVVQYARAIEIVTLMRDTYELSIRKLTGQDSAAADAIGQASATAGSDSAAS